MRYLFEEKDIKSITDCVNGLFRVEIVDDNKLSFSNIKSSKYYLMDSFGRIFDQPLDNVHFEKFGNFVEVEVNKSKLLIDGDLQVRFKDYHSIENLQKFYEPEEKDYFEITYNGGKKILINDEGKVISDKFEQYFRFINGIGCGRLPNQKWVFFNESGQIISREYDYVTPFFNKNYSYAKIGKELIVVDRNMVESKAPNNRLIWFIADDVIEIQKEGKEFEVEYIDKNGKKIFEQFKEIKFSKNRFKECMNEDGTICFVDINTGEKFGENYKYAENINDKILIVNLGLKGDEFIYEILKKDGRKFEFNSTAVLPLSDKVLAVYDDEIYGSNRYFLYDYDGNLLTDETFSEIRTFHDGISVVVVKDKKHDKKYKEQYMNENFKFLGNMHEKCGSFSSGFGVVRDKNHFDAMNKSGIYLSEISKFTKNIDFNFENFLNLPKDIVKDKNLVIYYYNYIINSIIEILNNSNNSDEIEKLRVLKDKIDKKFNEYMSQELESWEIYE